MRIERVDDAVTDGVIEVDLDVVRPRCPAAVPAEPPGRGPVVLCGVMNREREFLPNGIDRNRAAGVVVGLRADPRTYLGHCCSRYGDCHVWREMKRAADAGEQRVFEGRAPLPDSEPLPEIEISSEVDRDVDSLVADEVAAGRARP